MDKFKKNLFLILILAVISLSLIAPSATFGKYVLLSQKTVNVEVGGRTAYRNFVYVSGQSSYLGSEITKRNGLSPYTPFLTLNDAYTYLNNAKNTSVEAATDGTYYIILSGDINLQTIASNLVNPDIFNLEATITAFVDNNFGFSDDGYLFQNFESRLTLNGNICVYNKTIFKNLLISSSTAVDIYANGYSLIFESGIVTDTLNPQITLYGGQNVSSVSSTDLSVESGTYKEIYGGGKNSAGTVRGDVSLKISDSNVEENIFGGGNMGNVSGNINLSVKGVISNYIYGASSSSGTVTGNVNLEIKQSEIAQDIFGGGNGAGNSGNATISVYDSTANNIYGGGSGTGKVQSAVINVYDGTTVNFIVSGGLSQSGNKNYGIVNGDTYINFFGGEVSALYAGGYSLKKGAALVKGNVYIKLYAIGNLTSSKIKIGKLSGTAYFKDYTGSISKPSGFTNA